MNYSVLANKMKDDLDAKDKKIMGLLNEINELKRMNEILHKSNKIHLDEKEKIMSIFTEKCDKLEKENKELYVKLEKLTKNDFERAKDISTRKEFLDKKFSIKKYDDKYSASCLQKDILDFQEVIKDHIKSLKSTQEELITLVRESVSEVIEDYEIIIYGSYATNLCLPWSDIDLVLIPSVNNMNQNHFLALKLLSNNILV